MPRVSVLIPAYNAARYIEDSLRSVLDQTYRDIEVLVADDGSTDGTWRVLTRIARGDPRVVPIRNERNLGLARTLNRMVHHARGELVARLDADDIALPQRLERQLRAMDEGELGLCGTWAKTLGLRRNYVLPFPVTDAEIRAHLLFQSPFAHYSVMARRELLMRRHYRPEAGYAEDYDLWVRLSADTRMGNVPEPLVLYRQHQAQISASRAHTQWADARRVRRMALELLGPPASEEERVLHERVRLPTSPANLEELLAMERWLLRLSEHFGTGSAAARVVARQWLHVCARAGALGPRAAKIFLRSPLRKAGATPREAALVAALCCARIPYRSRLYQRLLEFALSTRLLRPKARGGSAQG